MSEEKLRVKLALYRPNLKTVYDRLTVAPVAQTEPCFIPKLPRTHPKRLTPGSHSFKVLPPQLNKLITSFTLSKDRLHKPMQFASDPESAIPKQDVSFDTALKAAFRTNYFEKITESASEKALKSPTLSLLNSRRKIKKKPNELSLKNSVPTLLVRSSIEDQSLAEKIPADILPDEPSLDPNESKASSDRLSRTPSLQDYPPSLVTVDLSRSFASKLRLNQRGTSLAIHRRPFSYRQGTCLKGSRVKAALHANFRPVIERELTPNHFKRRR